MMFVVYVVVKCSQVIHGGMLVTLYMSLSDNAAYPIFECRGYGSIRALAHYYVVMKVEIIKVES